MKTHVKCRTLRCGFQIPIQKDHCPGCGMPRSWVARVLTHLGARQRQPNLRQAEAEAWAVVKGANAELTRILSLEDELTGYHKPKMSPQQREAIDRAKAHIVEKAKPGLRQLKAIEVARWQNGWLPVVLKLSDERLTDAQLASIDQELYRHTRLGSALKKRWEKGIPDYEGLFDSRVRAFEPSVLRLALTIIKIREWISVRRTVDALGEVSSFRDEALEMEDMPASGISEWLEGIYDRDAELDRITQETLRWEAEEDVERLLG